MSATKLVKFLAEHINRSHVIDRVTIEMYNPATVKSTNIFRTHIYEVTLYATMQSIGLTTARAQCNDINDVTELVNKINVLLSKPVD